MSGFVRSRQIYDAEEGEPPPDASPRATPTAAGEQKNPRRRQAMTVIETPCSPFTSVCGRLGPPRCLNHLSEETLSSRDEPNRPLHPACARSMVWVRVEIMGSQNCGIVGKSQSVLMMIDPMISTRTRHRIVGP
jgi:hypothetical protein|eukprot:COSAG01_NODE_15702_length_1308_cov_1.792390_2_plen_134_part_00